MRRIIVFIVLILFLLPLCSIAEFYRYKDENGVLRFTDNIMDVPENQRAEQRKYSEADDLLTPEQKAKKRLQDNEKQDLSEKEKDSENSNGKKDKSAVPDKSGKLDELNKITQQLAQERNDLVKEREALEKLREQANTKSKKDKYNESAKRYNEKSNDYAKRTEEHTKNIKAFQDQQKNGG
ncbi:DUF4124 domain-containing protein [Desulfobacterales bacterium HSG16]|nr:DUF4124 domain-containing protein [Desulfobacterales bacterium HSG16]